MKSSETNRDHHVSLRLAQEAPPRSARFCVLGAAPGTGNLGVSALGEALIAGIARRFERPQIVAFDNGVGVRDVRLRVDGAEIPYRLCAAVGTRRIYRRDSLWRIRAAGLLGGMGHPAIRSMREADAVLSVSSGDSFTDLYSRRRFRIITQEMRVAIDQQRTREPRSGGLILLPQTIGPFESGRARRVARDILRKAAGIWSRDAESLECVRNLLGDAFDPARHRAGVDLAFALDAQLPALGSPVAELLPWMRCGEGAPLVGFNVSGLLCNQPDHAARYKLRAKYDEVVHRFLTTLLRESDARILFAPHVFTLPGHFEHDPDACLRLMATLDEGDRARVRIAPGPVSPGVMKWLIAQTDWFCGTRMHSTIAALSSGVPSAAIAYSRKTRGVFETCGLGDEVADPRRLNTDEMVASLWNSWTTRAATSRTLQNRLPDVLAQAERQLDEILLPFGGAPVLGVPLAAAA